MCLAVSFHVLKWIHLFITRQKKQKQQSSNELTNLPNYIQLTLYDLRNEPCLKSLGPIDRKFHGHGENDGFVLYEHIIKQFSSF